MKLFRLYSLLSFIFISMGLSRVVAIYWEYDVLNEIYAMYLVFGYVACYLTFKGKVAGLWLFIIFYLIQLVSIFSPEFNYNFTTGLSFFFSYHDGDRFTPFEERRGYSINFVSLAMIVVAFIQGLAFHRRKSAETL